MLLEEPGRLSIPVRVWRLKLVVVVGREVGREGGRDGRSSMWNCLFFCSLERRKGGRKEGGRVGENEMNEIPYLGTKQSEMRRKRAMLVVCRRRKGGREGRREGGKTDIPP